MAFLIQIATLEYPMKYGHRLYHDVEQGLNWIFVETEKTLSQYYPKHQGNDVVAYIWAWIVKCPSCSFESPLVGQWWLARESESGIYLSPSIHNHSMELKIMHGPDAPQPTCVDGEGTCLSCGMTISNEVVKKEILSREKERLMAVVWNSKGGKQYGLPTSEDLRALEAAEKVVSQDWIDWIDAGLIPTEEIPEDTRGSLSVRNYLPYWHKLLNSMQKLLFVTLIKKTREYGQLLLTKAKDEQYVQAVMTYLAFTFGKHINRNCRCASWDKCSEKIMHVLTYRGIGMAWDHVEVNPFAKGSGTLISIKKSTLDGIRYAVDRLADLKQYTIRLGSVSALDMKVDLIISDPPYYDDVRYAEFFGISHVWERRALKGFYDLGPVPKAEELSAGGAKRDDQFFQRLFNIACDKMRRCLNDRGILVMFFAHSSPEAWDFVINALQQTGFHITATWPVHTENTNYPIVSGKASIMSSIMIIGRKRRMDKSVFVEELEEEVRSHIKRRLNEFWDCGLRGADLTVSAMGATLDIVTKYSEIKSITGQMRVQDILNLVQKYVAEYVLNRYISRTATLDGHTSFYLYCRLSGLDMMSFDTANLVARSMTTDLKSLKDRGVIEFIKKGRSKGAKILTFNKRDHNDKISLIDCVHSILSSFDKSGFADAEKALNSVPYGRAEIKSVLESFLQISGDDPEKKVSKYLLTRLGYNFPDEEQSGLDSHF